MTSAEQFDADEARGMADSDLEALDRHWSDRLVVTPPGGGTDDKPTALRLVEAGVLAYAAVERTVDRVVPASDLIVSAVARR